uniref:Putative secreted peptide n=1 Tax=Anopheles braziliensis TaxID=58242 RepID=A0A2M3ZP15_9DIPT
MMVLLLAKALATFLHPWRVASSSFSFLFPIPIPAERCGSRYRFGANGPRGVSHRHPSSCPVLPPAWKDVKRLGRPRKTQREQDTVSVCVCVCVADRPTASANGGRTSKDTLMQCRHRKLDWPMYGRGSRVRPAGYAVPGPIPLAPCTQEMVLVPSWPQTFRTN